MINLMHPEASISRMGFGSIYRATAQMESGVSVYFINFGETIICIPLTPGWWHTVYEHAALLPYKNVVVIPPATNILMLSDCWRIMMDLMALKKNVTLIADFRNVKVDVPTVYDYCVHLPSIKDDSDLWLPENTTIHIGQVTARTEIRYIDITYQKKTLRLSPGMTNDFLTDCVADVGTGKIDRLATPWRFPIFGSECHNCIKYVEDYPMFKGKLVPFDFSCPEEFFEMQKYARENKWFKEPHKNFMGVGVV